jgi:hypothetical protein
MRLAGDSFDGVFDLGANAVCDIFCIHGFNPSPRLGIWCLLFAPVLNFIGLLFARVGAPELDKSQLAPTVPSPRPEGF